MKDSVKQFLKSPLSSYEIARRTGLRRQTIDKYRTGMIDLDNMNYKSMYKLSEGSKLILLEEWLKKIPNLYLAIDQYNDYDGEAHFLYNSLNHIVWVETDQSLNATTYPNSVITIATKTKSTTDKNIPTIKLLVNEAVHAIEHFNTYKDSYPADTWQLINWRYFYLNTTNDIV